MIAWVKAHLSHVLGVLALVLAAWSLVRPPPTSQIMGAAGAQFTGTQFYGSDLQLYEAANNAQAVPIDAGACANVDTTQAMVPGQYDTLWQGTIIDYDNIDASTSCSGGVCSSFLTSILPVDRHASTYCQMGGASCTNADGGGLDVSLLSFPPGGATAFGGTAHLVVNTAVGTISDQVCCGSLPCRARGRISATLATPFVPEGGSSGGSSSGSSSGGSSSGGSTDGGPIVSLTPDFASANGGESRTITNSGTPSLSGATVTVDGTSATVTGSTASSVTFNVPASTVSSTDGNGSTSAVVATTSGGLHVWSPQTPLAQLWYWPAYFGVSGDGVWNSQKVVTGATAGPDGGLGIVSVTDLTGNSHNLTPVVTNSNSDGYAATGGGASGLLPRWIAANNLGALTNASFASGTGTFFLMTAPSGSIGSTYMSDFGTGNLGATYWPDGTHVQQYAGATANSTSATAAQLCVLSGFTGATTSYVKINGGSATTGANPGTPTGTGVTVSGTNAGALTQSGDWFGAAFFTTLSTTGQANLMSYCAAEGE